MTRIHELIVETFRGKSLPRILLNQALKYDFSALQGAILDIGGGQSSYDRYFDRTHVTITSTNIDASRLPAACVDFNEPFPFADASFDGVLAMNVLYIMRDPDAVAKEIYRILKPGGRLYASSMFVFPENPEPEDFCRMTSMGLKRLTNGAGFALEKMVPVGGRCVSAEYLVDPAFVWPVLKILPRLAALSIDATIFKSMNLRNPIPPLYYLVARKPL